MSDEVIDRLARIETKQDAIMDSLKKINYTVYGNGKPGILEEMAVLRTKVEERTEPIVSKKQVLSLTGFIAIAISVVAQWLSNKFGVPQ